LHYKIDELLKNAILDQHCLSPITILNVFSLVRGRNHFRTEALNNRKMAARPYSAK